MSACHVPFESFHSRAVVLIWNVDQSRLASVSTIGQSLFSSALQHAFELVSEDVNVWVCAARKRSIDPNDVPVCNRNGHFVSQTRRLKFVAVVTFAVVLLLNAAIRAIDRDATRGMDRAAASQTVLPLDLLDKECAKSR